MRVSGRTTCLTYRTHVPLTSKDRVEGRIDLLDLGELFWIQLCGFADEADAVKWHWRLIRWRQGAFFFQSLVHMPTNCRVGAVSTDQNVASMCAVVGKVNRYALLALDKGLDSLSHADALSGDMAQ